MRTAGEMRAVSEEKYPGHVEDVASILRIDVEKAIEGSAEWGLRYADIQRTVADRTPTYHWVVAAFDKVMAELKVLGYTTEFNTTVAPYNPAQQYGPAQQYDPAQP